MTTSPNAPQEERPSGAPQDVSSFWQIQLALAEKDHESYFKSGKEVVDRYKGEKNSAIKKDTSRSFNILYSNVETLKAALYGRAAKPDVRRRFGDKDPIARTAAEIIERALIYSAECEDVDAPIEAGLHDYLLPGRGVVRVNYEPSIGQRPQIDPMTMQPAMGEDGQPATEDYLESQEVELQYTYWKDYLQSPARNWEGVWWVAFRHAMSRDELRENNFENAEAIPLNWQPDLGTGKKDVPEDLKKAEVWEIWDKSKKQRVWIVKGYPQALRTDEDPYGLEDFFPMPEPIKAFADTDTEVPVPEFHIYKDQADDLDEITARISRLTKALKRRGVYDKAVKELQQLARAGDNQFIPVENYAALSQKGGLQAAFQTEDISAIAAVLNELYKQRDALVQGIYEVSGIADIMRGSSDPNETLGAQQLKAQFGSQRIKKRQRAIQKWIRDLYKLKAEIIAEHFEPQTLQEMTGQPVDPQVIQLLRSDKLRSYRIDIETDSTIFEDAQSEKQSIVEMLTAVGGFFAQAIPVLGQAPELAPVAFEMLEIGLRAMKPGGQLEDTIEQAKGAVMQKVAAMQQQPQQGPPPDPVAAAKVEAEKQRVALEAQKAADAKQESDRRFALDAEKHQHEIARGHHEMSLKERAQAHTENAQAADLTFRQQDQGLKERAQAHTETAHGDTLNDGKAARREKMQADGLVVKPAQQPGGEDQVMTADDARDEQIVQALGQVAQAVQGVSEGQAQLLQAFQQMAQQIGDMGQRQAQAHAVAHQILSQRQARSKQQVN